MTDSVETPNTETQTDTTPPAPAPKPEPKADNGNDLPDWARTQISKANQEAANYRVQLREAERQRQALEEQVSTLTTEKTSASTSLTTVQGDFDRLVTAVQALFPEKTEVFTFAKTLQGDTEEELATHAAELKQMFGLSSQPSPAVDRSQGLGNGSSTSTPADEFAALLQSNLKR